MNLERMENILKKPEDIIGFLRTYNYGDRTESARVAVERFVKFASERYSIPEKGLRKGDPPFMDLFASELEKAGFAKSGEISHIIWTDKAERALQAALTDFENRSEDWQREVSQSQDDWRM